MLAALWRFRYFVIAAIIGELRNRFARSRLGLLWSVLHPLAQAAIFALVLAEVLGAKIGGPASSVSYPLYLLAGMSAWSLFNEILNRCLSVFIDYSGMMKKISFPRICLPFIVWGSALLNHLLLILAIFIVFLFFGELPSATWLLIPFGIALISLLAFGLGVLLGTLNVFARDIGQVVAVVLQLLFWMTPIVYPISIVPDNLRWLLLLNPLVPLVDIYQKAMAYNEIPELWPLIYPATLAIALVSLAFVLFKRASPELVDVL